MKYYKRNASVEAVNFDELVQHGIDNGGNIVNGMPWSFRYQGHAITHENDDCYLVPCANGGSLKFLRGEMLVTCGDGQLFPMSMSNFTVNYERAPLPFPEPSAPVEKCRHVHISYSFGSSLWVCADCDEQFNAKEYLGLIEESLVDE
jgi:hypothetical protein